MTRLRDYGMTMIIQKRFKLFGLIPVWITTDTITDQDTVELLRRNMGESEI